MRLLTKILKNLLILTTEDFKCNSCTKVFSTKDSLLNHEKSGHTENVPLLEDSNCKLSKETEVDFSKETEVNLSKETEVFCTTDSLLNHEKSVHTENVPLLKETYCEIEVNVQNPEKRPIPRTFRLNESMDVDLNNKDISLDVPEVHNRQ